MPIKPYFTETQPSAPKKMYVSASVSESGAELIRQNPTLPMSILPELIECESRNLESKGCTKYASILTEHDSAKVYTENFVENNATGIAHLSQCINDAPDQYLCELIGRYADERSLPFIVGVIYVVDLMKELTAKNGGVFPGFTYYRNIRPEKWFPKDFDSTQSI